MQNTNNKEDLKINDVVILKGDSASMLYDGIQLDKEKYGKIHLERIKGVVTKTWESYNHYLHGKYASVQWDDDIYLSKCIHVSWLKKV